MNVVEMVKGLYEYHRWANRRLFEVATSLGEERASRDVGKQFSYPTVRRMFGHLYGADKIWLARWTGNPAASPVPGDEFATLAAIRPPWDALERDQRAFVESLTPADLERIIEFRNMEGQTTRVPCGPSSSTSPITAPITEARSRR